MAKLKTQFDSLSYEDISRMTLDDMARLERLVKSGLTTSYRRLDVLKKSKLYTNFEDAVSYNAWFKKRYGRTYRESKSRLERQLKSAKTEGDKLKVLKSYASRIKRHLGSEYSSKSGVTEIRRRQLKAFAAAFPGSGHISRVDTKGRSGWMVSGHFMSDDEMSKFWSMYRKAAEAGSAATLSGGTNEALNIVVEAYYRNKDLTWVDAMNLINEQYEYEQRSNDSTRSSFSSSGMNFMNN